MFRHKPRGGTASLRLALVTMIVASACLADGGPAAGVTTGSETRRPQVWEPTSEDYPDNFETIPTEILADGVVTPAELERAVLASFACMNAKGLSFHPEIRYGISGWIVNVGYSMRATTQEDIEEANAQAMECEVAFTEPVWDAVRAEGTERDAQEVIETVAECMRSRGVSVDVDVVAVGLQAIEALAPDVFEDCWLAAH